ncbi:MAG: cytochrome c [Bacteroidetes bacterium]|nr:cytochrome c [Bacteroidota bacterium]
MKYFSVLFLALTFLIACGSESASDSTAAASATPAPPDGKKIYKINCVQCHGLRGNLGASGSFDLTSSDLSMEERINVITNGRNTMMPFKSLLDEDEIEAVAKYTLELKVSEE